MVEVLKMKFIDFAIIFSLFFICILTKNNISNRLICDNHIFNSMYNASIDNVVMDSLEAGFFKLDEHNNPIVDREIMSRCFESELSIILSDSSNFKAAGANYCLLIYICKDGYFIYNNMVWSDKFSFVSLNHSKRVFEIEEKIKTSYGIDLLFSSNDGENFKNTIKENSFIAVYESKAIRLGENTYKVYSISGAAIVEDRVKAP